VTRWLADLLFDPTTHALALGVLIYHLAEWLRWLSAFRTMRMRR
jgi:hypothetical protein